MARAVHARSVLGTVVGLIDTRTEYDHLFSIYVPIAIGVFALVLVLVLAAVLVYRRRPPARAARWHEHNRLEGSYAVLLACVAAFLLYLTFTAEHKVDTVADEERPSRRDRRHRVEVGVDVRLSGVRHYASQRHGRPPAAGRAGGRGGPLPAHLGRRDPLVLDSGAALQARRDPGLDPGR